MNFMFGLCHPGDKLDMVKEAGVQWLRVDIPWPFKDEYRNHTQAFEEIVQTIEVYDEKGFHIMGITPFPGYTSLLDQGTKEYFKEYRDGCRYLADFFKHKIRVWQICNEPNIIPFRQGLNEEDMIQFIKSGAEGIKIGHPKSFIGINPSIQEKSFWEYINELYIKEDFFDYVGVDGYPGSWGEGGPDTWGGWIDDISEKVKKPIIICEYGYSSSGQVLSMEEIQKTEAITDVIKMLDNMGFYDEKLLDDEYSVQMGTLMYKMHFYRKWLYAWEDGHTEWMQAVYLAQTLQMFVNHPNVIGAFWYCGQDSETCFWCGQKGCPCETAWGLFDTRGKPKPSYYEYKTIIINNK